MFEHVCVQNTLGAIGNQEVRVKRSLPNYKIKVGKGQHHDAQEGRKGPMDHGREHVFHRHHYSLVLVSDACDETLKTNGTLAELI